VAFKTKSWVVCFVSLAVVNICVFLAGSQTGFAQSSTYCDGYARDYANRNSHYDSGGGALGGAARGAGRGALFGAVVGGGKGAGRGAALGAGLGAVAGGARRANSWQYYYDRGYNECMRGSR
jgi:hypothetical protein